MDGPGLSLFQGSESIHLDNENQRIEEEEAIQDQQRRNEELGDLLTNAFDDLIDDDDGSSVVSDDTNHGRSRTSMYLSGGGDANVSEHSAHYKHCFRTSPGSVDVVEHPNKEGPVTDVPVLNGHSTEPLKALYDVRTREIQRLAEETNQWRHQVALKDAEKERLQISLNQQVNQLALANSRINGLTAEVDTLKQNVLNAENSKSSVLRELESCRGAISELRTRCDALQRNKEAADAVLLSSEQRHQQEAKVLTSRIEDLRNDLTLKTVQQERTAHKMAQLLRDHEAQLLQRTETIAKLSRDLEAAEKRAGQHAGRRSSNVGELNDLNAKLKQELERCVGGLRGKSEECRRLQEMLDMKEGVVKTLLEQEACCATEVAGIRAETEQLHQECRERETRETELRLDNERLREAVAAARKEVAALELQSTKKRLVFSAQVDAGASVDAGEELALATQRAEVALAELEEVKRLYVEVCAAKEAALAEAARLRDQHDQRERDAKPDSVATNFIGGHDAGSTADADWQTQMSQLESRYQARLDEELAKQSQQFRETEELIKQEAIKLFSDDIEALETRRDDAVFDLEQCREKLRACGNQLRDVKSCAQLELDARDAELARLRKDCDNKVELLKEAERRFEVFEANACDEFEKRCGEQQRTIDALTAKCNALKAAGEGRKAGGKGRMERCRSVLAEIDRRLQGLMEGTTPSDDMSS